MSPVRIEWILLIFYYVCTLYHNTVNFKELKQLQMWYSVTVVFTVKQYSILVLESSNIGN
jgi:hypothetical protein